jgi:hypothetical protein
MNRDRAGALRTVSCLIKILRQANSILRILRPWAFFQSQVVCRL